MSSLTLHSFAKLNLYLEVVNRRADGFHNIKTIFERISLSDKITLSPRKDAKIKVYCSDRDVPIGETNLCCRAARLLAEGSRKKNGLNIRIVKRIPVGAGLGGGSSNAAATLMGLNRLWGLGLSRKKLCRLAARLGSDVPFFIYDAPFAFGIGRGENIRVLDAGRRTKLWHVVVVPRLKVLTPRIYEGWDRSRARRSGLPGLTSLAAGARIKNLPGEPELCLFNGLEPVTMRLYPQVRSLKERLSSEGIKAVLMSGSGPAVFCVFPSRKEAFSLARRVKRQNNSWRVFLASTV